MSRAARLARSPRSYRLVTGATPTAATSGEGLGSGQRWAMTTPATAGGYTKHTPMPSGMLAIGTANATALMSAVVLSGGKPDGGSAQPKYVSADYLAPGNQAIAYVGFTGTFSPASVMDAVGKIANSVVSESAGPHGGQLACGGMSPTARPSGTAGGWATPASL